MSDEPIRAPMPVEGQDPLWLAGIMVYLIVSMCAGFTFVASSVLFAYDLLLVPDTSSATLAKLAVKSGAFGVTTILILARLYAKRSTLTPMALPPPERPPPPFRIFACAGAALVIIAVLSLFHLDRYPHAEPDETHHLIVARNIAQFGVYGSGRPETGFIILDEYDSVGPPVIIPVAAVFRVFGANLAVARAVMVAFYLVFCVTLFILLRPLTGPLAAALCVLFAFSAPGSFYLSRTLYGEVPALAFFILGLILWRRSLASSVAFSWLIGAGLCFGIMVVTKNFMLMSLWAFAGVWIYDRISFRRICLFHIVTPWVVAGIILAGWIVLRDISHRGTATATATQFGMYQHNLMFGLQSVPITVGWLKQNAGVSIFGMVYMFLIASTIFVRRYDPALVLLFLFAPFELYWWIFYTTGNIPRYAWYGLVILNLFPAMLLAVGLKGLITKANRSALLRPVWFVVAIAVATPAVAHLAASTRRATSSDDMRDDRELATYVQTLPSNSTIVTTFYPAERVLNFFADRAVSRAKGLDGTFDTAIVDAASQANLLKDVNVLKTIGRYAIIGRRR